MTFQQPKELFTVRQRQTPTQTRGVIMLIGELDFEMQSMYTLTIYATVRNNYCYKREIRQKERIYMISSTYTVYSKLTGSLHGTRTGYQEHRGAEYCRRGARCSGYAADFHVGASSD